MEGVLDQMEQLAALQRNRSTLRAFNDAQREEIIELTDDLRGMLQKTRGYMQPYNPSDAIQRLGAATIYQDAADPVGFYNGTHSTIELSQLADHLGRATVDDMTKAEGKHCDVPEVIDPSLPRALQRQLHPQQEQLVRFISDILWSPQSSRTGLFAIEAGPGCGKSYGLETAVHRLLHRGEYIILARNGIVANWYNDEAAATIQTGLSIPVKLRSSKRNENESDEAYALTEHTTLPKCSTKFINIFDEKFRDLQIVLGDEFNTVDAVMLHHIYLRLRELQKCVPICFVLDNSQLGPVQSSPLYRQLEDRTIARLLHQSEAEGSQTVSACDTRIQRQAQARLRAITRSGADRWIEPTRLQNDIDAGLDAFEKTLWMRMSEYIRSDNSSTHITFLRYLHDNPKAHLSLSDLCRRYTTISAKDFQKVSAQKLSNVTHIIDPRTGKGVRVAISSDLQRIAI
jgi:hypothetical protein